MKYLRTLSILVGCFVAVASVQAMDQREPGPSLRSVGSIRGSVDQERDDIAVYVVGRAVLSSAKAKGVLSLVETFPGLYEEYWGYEGKEGYENGRIKSIQSEVGRYYLDGRIGAIIPLLEQIAHEYLNEEPSNNYYEGAALHYADMLLQGIGVEEGKKEEANKTAFSILMKAVDKDMLPRFVLRHLFTHFLPQKPLVRDLFYKVKKEVEDDIQEFLRLRIPYSPGLLDDLVTLGNEKMKGFPTEQASTSH